MSDGGEGSGAISMRGSNEYRCSQSPLAESLVELPRVSRKRSDAVGSLWVLVGCAVLT